MTGTPEGSTESGFMGGQGIKKLFAAFPWVVISTGPGGLWLCVYYMTGTPEGSTESGFMEKPGGFSKLYAAFPWVEPVLGREGL